MSNLVVENIGGPRAKIIADSISEQGSRITTMECKFHRFVLAEMNTHRVFSRNSASSRAIPVHKIIDRVKRDPAYPLVWPNEKQGMVGGLPFNDTGIEHCRSIWAGALETAIIMAEELVDIKLHKSLINRLLEPFMWHTAIITATDWANFFNQRCDPAAMPEMKAIADAMQIAYYSSEPHRLAHGEWHMPYISVADQNDPYILEKGKTYDVVDALKRISVARCARVSYLTHDGKRDMQEDIALYERLRTSGHWSPFEHVATPIATDEITTCGNFTGWMQFRKQFPGENRDKFIPNLPELAHVQMKMEYKEKL